MSYGSRIKTTKRTQMKQVINIKKMKSTQEILLVANHNLRQVDSRNVNKKKTPLNNYLIGGPQTDTLAEIEEKLAKCPKYRKDAVKTVNLVLSASPEFFDDKTKLKEWEKLTQEWAEKTFGKENIIYSVVHYDEKTPHFHICLVPIKDGKLNASYWLDGPAKLNKLHDSLNKAVKSLGIKRGQKEIKSTQAELSDFYKKVNSSTAFDKQLDKKLDDLFEQLASPSLVQKLKPWAVIDEVVKPLMKQLKNNLSHYRTKAKQSEQVEKDLLKAKQRISDLELKLDTLGLKPDISFLELAKFKAEPIIHVVKEPLFRDPPEGKATYQAQPVPKNRLSI